MRCVRDTGHMVGSRHWFRQWGGLGGLREGGCDRLLPLLRRRKEERGTRQKEEMNGLVRTVIQGITEMKLAF